MCVLGIIKTKCQDIKVNQVSKFSGAIEYFCKSQKILIKVKLPFHWCNDNVRKVGAVSMGILTAVVGELLFILYCT